MYIFKSCPKCRGDLAVERDGMRARRLTKDAEFTCLQCGYYLLASQRRDLLVRIATYLQERRASIIASRTGGAQVAA